MLRRMFYAVKIHANGFINYNQEMISTDMATLMSLSLAIRVPLMIIS